MEQEGVEQLSSYIADIYNEIYIQHHNQAAEMKKAIKKLTDSRIEKAIDRKAQATFTEAVGSYQLKTIATDATVDILKDDEYLQRLGIDFLTKAKSCPI